MSDNGEAEEDEPVVELGDGPDVEGAPVSRVASRLFFPIEESEVLRREGETTIRTPDGPQTVGDVLGETDEVYFETNADLVNAVRSVVGTGPVRTAGAGSDSGEADDGGFEFDDAGNGDGAGDESGSGDAEGTGDEDGAEADAEDPEAVQDAEADSEVTEDAEVTGDAEDTGDTEHAEEAGAGDADES